MSRRARAVAMLGLSAISAGIAASLVNDYAADVRAQVGPLVPVVVARAEIPRGRVVTPTNSSSFLAERRVPERFVPPDSFRSAREALGRRALVQIASGSYLGSGQLGFSTGRGARETASALTSEARVVEVPVAGASALGAVLRPGTRVDVLVTSERAPGPARTYLALQRVELVDFRGSGGSALADGEGGRADAIAALRVSLSQAVLLTAAQNFARELRLVPRPAADRRRLPATAVTASDLHP